MDAHTSGIAWGRWAIGLGAFALVAAGGWYLAADRSPAAAGQGDGNGGDPRNGIQAEVITPKAGGIPLLCTQPGSVEPFDSQVVYAEVSGPLKTLTVDRGSFVKKGDLLAEIDIPEREAEVARCKAKVDDAKAKVRQTEAFKIEAEAEARAADASALQAATLVKAKTAFREYREKQLNRIKDLVARKAENQPVQDEQEDYYLSAVEAENAAKEKVIAEKERALAAKAKLQRVDADIAAAKADVAVAAAELTNARVWVGFGRITSEYTGVVTQRGYHVGDFIKTGDVAGNVPIVTVAAIDVMRVVIPVPDRDVPYVAVGKPAELTFDALPGEVYQTEGTNKVVISRYSYAEDYETRLMRVEVDVRNANGRLKQGMYGKATLRLTEGEPGAVHIASAALTGRASGGRGTVRVVRDGKIQTVPVKYGMDNGVDVEIVTGLTTSDQVVIGTNVPVTDGSAVNVKPVEY